MWGLSLKFRLEPTLCAAVGGVAEESSDATLQAAEEVVQHEAVTTIDPHVTTSEALSPLPVTYGIRIHEAALRRGKGRSPATGPTMSGPGVLNA